MLCKADETGQGLIEYALLLVLLALLVFALVVILGQTIGNVFSTINSTFVAH
jgi:pilus assembly protein Flp/PilA